MEKPLFVTFIYCKGSRVALAILFFICIFSGGSFAEKPINEAAKIELGIFAESMTTEDATKMLESIQAGPTGTVRNQCGIIPLMMTSAKGDAEIGALLDLAKHQEREGKFAEAIKTYRVILEISPDNEEASHEYLRLRLEGPDNRKDSSDSIGEDINNLQDLDKPITVKRKNSSQRQDGLQARIYQLEIQVEIEQMILKNWYFPVVISNLGEYRGIEAVLVMTVREDGVIIRTSVKKKSSCPAFDASLLKAIDRSNLLPPFPAGYNKSSDDIEMKFSFSDLVSDRTDPLHVKIGHFVVRFPPGWNFCSFSEKAASRREFSAYLAPGLKQYGKVNGLTPHMEEFEIYQKPPSGQLIGWTLVIPDQVNFLRKILKRENVQFEKRKSLSGGGIKGGTCRLVKIGNFDVVRVDVEMVNGGKSTNLQFWSPKNPGVVSVLMVGLKQHASSQTEKEYESIISTLVVKDDL